MKKWYYTLKTLQVSKDSILYIPLNTGQVIDYFNRERPAVYCCESVVDSLVILGPSGFPISSQ